MLNAPGQFWLFVSHTQRDAEGKLLAVEIFHELCPVLTEDERGGVWLDVKMEDKSEAAMKEGAVNAKALVCIVTDQYFTRPLCCSELRWAIEARVPIIPVVRVEDKSRIGELLELAPEDIRKVLQNLDFIDINRGHADYLRLGLELLLKRLAKISDAPPGSDSGWVGKLRLCRPSDPLALHRAARPQASASEHSVKVSSTQCERVPAQQHLRSWRDLSELQVCELLDGKWLHIRSGSVDRRWQHMRQLAECAYGTVWLAEELVQKRSMNWERKGTSYVAVKQICKARMDANQGNLFEDTVGEIEVLRKLKGDGIECIVELVNVGHDENNLYVLLEFVNNSPKNKQPQHWELFDHVRAQPDGRLAEPEAREIFLQLIDALEHLHRRGIYHLDISLENILMKSKGNAMNAGIKLIDFGLALLAHDSHRMISSDTALPSRPAGKRSYASPEVYRNEAFDGESADLWSAAVVLFTMLTGKFVYGSPEDEDRSFTTLARCAGFFPKGNISGVLRQRSLSISAAAEDLLSRLLIPEPADARLSMKQLREHAWVRDPSAWQMPSPVQGQLEEPGTDIKDGVEHLLVRRQPSEDLVVRRQPSEPL